MANGWQPDRIAAVMVLIGYRVLARDGHLLPQPYKLDVLTISPGERWDVLLDTSKPGRWAWHCHVLPHAEGEKGLYGLTTVVIVEE